MTSRKPSKDITEKTWSREGYLLAAGGCPDPEKVNEFFADEGMYWAKTLPKTAIQDMIDNSLNFCLYHVQDSKGASFSKEMPMVGYARCITDYITVAYLTDVFVVKEHQGTGLGKWMVQCIGEVFDDMPHLRRSLLITGDWNRSVPFYEKVLDMHKIGERLESDNIHEQGVAVLTKVGKGASMDL